MSNKTKYFRGDGKLLDNIVGKIILRSELMATLYYKNPVVYLLRRHINRRRLVKFNEETRLGAYEKICIFYLFFGKMRLDLTARHDLDLHHHRTGTP